MLSPEVATIMARDADQQRHAELRRRVDAEMLASRQRRQQREHELDAGWRKRCEQRGMKPFPRPRFQHSRDDGVETLAILGFEDRRMIWGCATTATVSSNNQSLDPAGASIQFPIPLKCAHKYGAIGQVVHVRRSPKSIFIRAVLDDTAAADHAWRLIEAGEMAAFSVGPERGACECTAEVDGARFYRKWALAEVSITREPANPDAWLRVYVQ